MKREHIKQVFVRRIGHGDDEIGGDRPGVEERLYFQDFILEQMSREMDLMVEVMTAMDRKLEWLEEELAARSGESTCKFEAVFEAIDALWRGRRLRRLGDPPPV